MTWLEYFKRDVVDKLLAEYSVQTEPESKERHQQRKKLENDINNRTGMLISCKECNHALVYHLDSDNHYEVLVPCRYDILGGCTCKSYMPDHLTYMECLAKERNLI